MADEQSYPRSQSAVGSGATIVQWICLEERLSLTYNVPLDTRSYRQQRNGGVNGPQN
jgi:hypothetical protein